jgi:hypothetical protein
MGDVISVFLSCWVLIDVAMSTPMDFRLCAMRYALWAWNTPYCMRTVTIPKRKAVRDRYIRDIFKMQRSNRIYKCKCIIVRFHRTWMLAMPRHIEVLNHSTWKKCLGRCKAKGNKPQETHLEPLSWSFPTALSLVGDWATTLRTVIDDPELEVHWIAGLSLQRRLLDRILVVSTLFYWTTTWFVLFVGDWRPRLWW